MGLFGLIGGILGGNSSKKASQQATDALIASNAQANSALVAQYQRGIDLQNQQYQQTRADYMPYTSAGTAALGGYGDLLGTNGTEAQAAGIEGLRQGPLYSALYNRGEEALLQNAAATGGLRGGNTQRGLADFGADTLAGVYGNQLSNLYNLAGLGLGATGQVAGFGANAADNITQLYGNMGQANANNFLNSGMANATNFLTKGGINAANWQNAGKLLDKAASAFLPGGGGVQGALKSIL